MALRTLRLLMAWAALMSISTMVPAADDGEPAPHAYRRYQDLFARDDAHGLLALADSIGSSGPHPDMMLSLLVRASGEFRRDSLMKTLVLLDSLQAMIQPQETRLAAAGLKMRAQVMQSVGESRAGLSIATEGLRMATVERFPEEHVVLRVLIAELLTSSAEYGPALEHLNAALMTSERVGFQRGVALTDIALGNIRFAQARYREALSKYEQVYGIALSHGWVKLARNALNNIGSAWIMLERFDDALAFFDSSLAALGPTQPGIRAMLLSHSGYCYREMGALEKAVDRFVHCIALCDSIGDRLERLKASQHLARALWSMGRRADAIRLARKTESTAERLNRGEDQVELLWDIYAWYSELGQTDSAMHYLERYAFDNDSMVQLRFDRQLAYSEVILETERKERRIAEQDQALTLAAEQDRRKSTQRNAFIVATALLALIALLLYRSMRNRQRLARKEKELHDEQVDQLLSQQEMKSINAMLDGQEQERERVSKELHDHVGHLLGTIKHQLGELEEQVADVKSEQSTQYRKVTGLLDNAAGELRRISHDMAAATLNRFGLEKALKDLRDTIHINGRLQVELNTFGLEKPLERGVEIAVYRIVQEAVSNVLKHAEATELSIAVTHAPGRLSVLVGDNGIGFDADATSSGVGLANIRSRAAALGAQVQIDSTPDKGTTISVECSLVE